MGLMGSVNGIVKLRWLSASLVHGYTKPRLSWLPLSTGNHCVRRVALPSLLPELRGVLSTGVALILSVLSCSNADGLAQRA